MDTAVDLARLSAWIGRTEEAEDCLTIELVRRFLVTVDGASDCTMANGASAPLGIHWCIAPPALPATELGRDGHPALGGFLPPVPFQRRMWAGGKIRHQRPLRIGATIRRRSTVAEIEVKEGRSGRLCFVAVDHSYSEGDEIAVTERHDIVYRDPAPAIAPAPASSARGTDPFDGGLRPFMTTSTLLFRYSALTFNGHRIHYDLPYAQEVEGYPGLVVHGPLQATWMLHFAQRVKGKPPAVFSFRAIKPLICGDSASVGAEPQGNGLRLFVSNGRGEMTMMADATW